MRDRRSSSSYVDPAPFRVVSVSNEGVGRCCVKLSGPYITSGVYMSHERVTYKPPDQKINFKNLSGGYMSHGELFFCSVTPSI